MINYRAYTCCHSSGNPRGSSLGLVKNRITHADVDVFVTYSIQLSLITITLFEANNKHCQNIGSIYCSPAYAI